MSSSTMPVSSLHGQLAHNFIAVHFPSTDPLFNGDFFQRIGLLLQPLFIAPLPSHRLYNY